MDNYEPEENVEDHSVMMDIVEDLQIFKPTIKTSHYFFR